MHNLTEIEQRHVRDRWKDVGFIALAALLVALAIGAVTKMGAGKPIRHTWTVTVIEGPVELAP